MTNTTQTDGTDSTKDPGQISPPYVDTDVKFWIFSPGDYKLYAPVLALAVVTLVSGLIDVVLAAGMGAVTLFALLSAYGLKATNKRYTSPRDRLRQRADNWHREWHRDENDSLAEVTGVASVSETGIVEMDDGRQVGIVPITPRNTAQMDSAGRDRLAAELSDAIDTKITDVPFRFYSTTRDTDDAETLAEQYREAAFAEGTDGAQEAVLADVADWLESADAPNWGARDWRHYIIVDADSDDVTGYDVPSLLDMASPFRDVDRAGGREVEGVVNDRVETVTSAINSVTGLSAGTPSPRESLTVAREHWGRSDDLADDLVADAVDGTADMGRLVDPETWNPRDGWVDLGGEYARVMWIGEYANEVESLWLKHITTMRGIDATLCVNATPVRKKTAIEDIGSKIADVGSEGDDREENLDVSAMDTDDANKVNVHMRKLFRDTDSQPWDVSSYVMVRADDRAALDAAADRVASFRDVDGARRGALEERSEEVKDALSMSPASTTPVTPGTGQGNAFRAAGPLTRDVWDAQTDVDKTKRVPGAVVGSMFPPAAVSAFETDGMDWGRNEENGSLLRLSPHRRGGAPHILTIGQTRAGKTYAAGKAALRWYLERDDRTLILVDTQGGFEGITELCDGEHVVIDGSQTVNPLHLDAADVDEDGDTDPFGMTVEETVGFVLNLLRADGVQNPGQYSAMLSQAAARALTNAGIDRDDPSTFDNGQPHLGDMIGVLTDMQDDPTEYSWTDEEDTPEVESQGEQIGELLTKLRSFKDEGRFASLVGEDELGIMDGDVDMAYLDLSRIGLSDDAEKSAMLQLMLSQVREKIRHTEGECVLLLDEAHVLLDTPTTANWLQRAAREFARFDTALWFLSQSPQDFVSGDGEGDARDTIRQQMGVTQFFRTPSVSDEVLAQFDLNATQRRFVRNKATRGKSDADDTGDYSECLLNFADYEGWIPCYVESSPLEDRALTFNKGTGDTPVDAFEQYMAGEGAVDDGEQADAPGADDETADAEETDGQTRDARGRFA